MRSLRSAFLLLATAVVGVRAAPKLVWLTPSRRRHCCCARSLEGSSNCALSCHCTRAGLSQVADRGAGVTVCPADVHRVGGTVCCLSASHTSALSSSCDSKLAEVQPWSRELPSRRPRIRQGRQRRQRLRPSPKTEWQFHQGETATSHATSQEHSRCLGTYFEHKS